MIHPAKGRSPASGKRRIHKFEWQLCSQMLYCDLQPTRKSVLMESILSPGTGIAYAPCVLYAWQKFLRAYSSCIVQWMMICPSTLCRLGRMKRVKSHKDHAIERGDVLEEIHPVGQADRRNCAGRWGSSDIIPRRPGHISLWHQLHCVSILCWR